MRTTGAAGADRSGGERWTIERHGRRNLRRRQFPFPYAGSGRVAIPLQRRRITIAASSGRWPQTNLYAQGRRSAAKKWRRGGGRPSINPDCAINSLLTRFTQRHRTDARIGRPRLQAKAEFKSHHAQRFSHHPRCGRRAKGRQRSCPHLSRHRPCCGGPGVETAVGRLRAGDDRVARARRVLSAAAAA